MNNLLVALVVALCCGTSFQLDDFCDVNTVVTFIRQTRMACIAKQAGATEGPVFDRLKRIYYKRMNLTGHDWPVENVSPDEKAKVIAASYCFGELYTEKYPADGVIKYDCDIKPDPDSCFDQEYNKLCPNNSNNKRRSIAIVPSILKQLRKNV